ncbi:MAG: tetratricopeptide repeat protein [Candidatus Brocadiaceae bacterium]|nr:tetratricopeptide repeat protein [Candidatus Brocadiaceae bacterium]
MATTLAKQLDELLAAPLTRDNYDQLVTCVYDSYATVDQADRRIRQMEADRDQVSDDEQRDLSEKLGILLLARGRYAEAAERLRPVRSRKNAAHFLGRALLAMGRTQEGVDLLQAEAGQDPAIDVLLVEAYCDLQQPQAAVDILKKHAKAEPTAALLYARGLLAEADGDYAEAMRLYESALDLDPEHARSLFRLARNADLNGDDRRAMELYGRCADLRPTYVGALINLGILSEDHNEYDRAIDCYKRVLAIDPRHKQAQLYLKDAESSLTMFVDAAKTRDMRRMEELFNMELSAFELSARSRTCLDRRDIKTLGALTKVTREELLSEKNFGDTSLEEIEQLMARYDLQLGQEAPREEDDDESDALTASVETLELSTRCRRCLERLGVATIGDLVRLSEADLVGVPNFGATSLNEIVLKLESLGLELRSE